MMRLVSAGAVVAVIGLVAFLIFRFVHTLPTNPTSAQANTNLITAAPELLESSVRLAAAVHAFTEAEGFGTREKPLPPSFVEYLMALAQLDAAIAKAEGR